MATQRTEQLPTRRQFLGTAAMSLTAGRFVTRTEAAEEGEPRQLAALGRATRWLNSPPPSTDLIGKVVLVQFGTYTCINWLRTLPYVRAWAQKYKQRMTMIGVHTPEFSFEKNLDNVRRAVQPMKLDYPIAIDNDYAIWRAFNNRYWPALYFVDASGRLRDHHFGEGEYERSEQLIRRLLNEGSNTQGDRPVEPIVEHGIELPADWGNLKSPELYLGHGRTQNFASPGGTELWLPRVYVAPARLALNHWALAGEWTMASEPTVLNRAPGRIVCRFHARDVHLVMGPLRQDRHVRFRVSLDDQPGVAGGVDVDERGNGTVVEQRLYQVIRQRGPVVDRTLSIEFLDAGVEAFAFTFG
jgi:hypothetical protein